MSAPPYRLMLVDDHPVLREGMAMMIDAEEDLIVSMEASSGEEALTLLDADQPDLMVIDLSLEEMNGLELIEKALERHPEQKLLVLSAHEEERFADKTIRTGARGYVMKSAPRVSILEAIRAVLKGDIYLSSEIGPKILKKMLQSNPQEPQEIDQVLSNREQEIFRMIGSGLDTDTIARQLFLSPKTIRAHRNNIMKKLNLQGSIQLYQSAYQWLSEQNI